MKTSSQPLKQSSLDYSSHTLKRAERALYCSPFRLGLFITMKTVSVPLPTIAGVMGMKHGYTFSVLSEQKAEKELMWLIAVGILRREVDGQGITDSFRLTPLGRQLVFPGNFPQPAWWERLLNLLTRWFYLPFV